MNLLILLLTYTISSIIGVFLIFDFEKTIDNKSNNLYDKRLHIIFSCILLFFINLLNNPFLNLFTTCLIVLIAIRSYFQKFTKEIIITNICFLVFITLIEELTYVFISFIFDSTYLNYTFILMKELYLIIISKALILLLYKPVISLITSKNFNYLKHFEIKILFYAFFLLLIAILCIAIVSKTISIWLNIFFTICCLLIYIRLFIITSTIHDFEFDLRVFYLLETKYDNLTNEYKKLLDQYKDSRRIIHDIPKQLSTIKEAYYLNPTLGEKYSLEFLQNIKKQNSTNEFNYSMHTIILNKYQKICLQKNIGLNIFIEYSINNLINDFDINTILCNIFDNAIENVSKSKPFIDYKVYKSSNYLIISVANTFNKKPKIINNTIKSTKKDFINHGYGIENIKLALQHYNGNYQLRIEDDMFIFDVIIPLS